MKPEATVKIKARLAVIHHSDPVSGFASPSENRTKDLVCPCLVASRVSGVQKISRKLTRIVLLFVCALSFTRSAFPQTETNKAQDASAPETGGALNLTAYASAGDIGQQFAAAYAAHGDISYYIPAGSYSTSHSITIAPHASGRVSLYCAPGTTIQYSGSGDAFAVLGSGQSQANVVLSGCRFTWTGASGNANGVHLKAFNKGTIIGVRADGFKNGDGFLNEGVNTVDFYSIQSTGNRNGIHNVGTVVSGEHYASNAIHFTGGVIANNSEWGVYEDAALSSTVGADENNSYRDLAFEANGTPSPDAPSGGQIFLQACLGCAVHNNYFEYSFGGALTMTSQITLGDLTHNPVTPVIRDNFFATNGGTVTNAINAVNCDRGIIEGNLDEDGPEPNFVNNGSRSQWMYIGFNYSAATNYVTGAGILAASVTANGIATSRISNPANATMQLLWNGNNTILRSASSGEVYIQDGSGNNMATFTTKSTSVANGSNVVYRCTSAGTLPIGALTISSGNCGSAADTGLRVK